MRGKTKFNGNALQNLIRSNKLTYEAFAEDFGVNVLTVINWIRKEHRPSTHNLQRLAEFFGVDETVLLEDAEQVTKDNADKIAKDPKSIFLTDREVDRFIKEIMQLKKDHPTEKGGVE